MDSPTGIRTHHLHAFTVGAANIERHLNFRDYLRAYPVEAKAYEALKRILAARALDNREAYSDGKTEFILEMERRAAAWRRVMLAP